MDLCAAKSDGELLTMADVDIAAIAKHGQQLYNAPEESVGSSSSLDSSSSSASTVHAVYSRGWIKQQRVALKRRLGAETGRAGAGAVAAASKFLSTKELLRRSDVVQQQQQQGASSSKRWRGRGGQVEEEAETEQETEQERESWFVRLFRYLVTG